MTAAPKIFNTDKRIRLGIWGLGRGMSFYGSCKPLNIDVVAGCDYNEHMRKNFLACNPGAFATADAAEFLKYDMDAVLVATFCPAHADDAIRALQAGKHVLSEVTSFHTMAEGVRLVEAVEQSGKTYNLAENYPFSKENMFLAEKWREGLFGKLTYAEYEYVHELCELSYTYIDGKPIQPGNTVHSWRSWLNYHYYCTHSLGPVMVITGERPTRVVALPCKNHMDGYIAKDGGFGVAPSLISMSNGGLVRNLMGATTKDSHHQRLWGTLGAAEIAGGLHLTLGACGGLPSYTVSPSWNKLGELAEATGHGGGDFWVLYYFARQILTGEKAPFDIYSACDVTIPGILAYRSSTENGKAYDVPDFRHKKERDAWRNDNFEQPRYDAKNGPFPKNSDLAITGRFSAAMKHLIASAATARAFFDWAKVKYALQDKSNFTRVEHTFIKHFKAIVASYAEARKIADAYPASDAARVLYEMLEVGNEKTVMEPAFRTQYLKLCAACPAEPKIVETNFVSSLVTFSGTIKKAAYPKGKLAFTKAPRMPSGAFDIRPAAHLKNGIVYIKASVARAQASAGRLHIGADGPFKAWVNKEPAMTEPKASNPIHPVRYHADVNWKQGRNEVMIALYSNRGKAWGAVIRADDETV